MLLARGAELGFKLRGCLRQRLQNGKPDVRNSGWGRERSRACTLCIGTRGIQARVVVILVITVVLMPADAGRVSVTEDDPHRAVDLGQHEPSRH